MKKNIVLIGMSGAGKSTLGVLLAKRLGYGFIDTDLLISQKTNSTLVELLEKDSVENFLKIEEEICCKVKGQKNIIATGGSVVYSEKAMAHLKKIGIVVWLYVEIKELEKRIIGNFGERGIVMPVAMSFAELYQTREKLYQKHADVKIKCDKSIVKTIDLIVEALNSKYLI